VARGIRRLAIGTTLLVLCAYGPAVRPATGDVAPAPASALVWPRPPAEPAVRYTRAIASPADWGVERGIFGRIVDALTGKDDERFARPTGVAARDGVLYVADPGAPALWIVDATNKRLVKVTTVGDATLASPVAVALGTGGSVFVADSVLKQVFELDRAGSRIRSISAGLSRPAGLAFDAENRRLYVADPVAQRIAVYGPDGALVRTIGGPGAGDGEFNGPTHLALDRNGVLLVTDALNFRVQAFDRDGRFLWKMGRHGDGSGDFAAPKGVASDAAGHVYVVDALFDVVQVFDRSGALLVAFGERGTRDGQFWLPGGIFISPEDDIYVADSYNRRIQVFRRATGNNEAAKQ